MKIIKWGLPLLAAAAVGGSALLPVSAASATTTTYDYTIKLISIQCNKKQDTDRDEPYLKINGTTVWSATKVKKGATINLQGTNFDFDGVATLELYEKDSGNDDHLGSISVDGAAVLNNGDVFGEFDALNNAKYTIIYDVDPA